MIDSKKIIKEATEAVEKRLDAGYAVQQLLNIINHQQAEIDRLIGDVTTYKIRWVKAVTSIEAAKSETIKEFTEEFEKRCIEGGIYPAFVKSQLEDVKKEMVGE